MKIRGFTLIEILLAVTISVALFAYGVYFFNLLENNRYNIAKDNFRTFLINQKYKAAFTQEEYTLTFDDDNNIIGDGDLLSTFTNDLKILETSATKIIFFNDSTVQESYIITSSIDGKYTNKLIINIIGKINYE